jgi:hypothetical protein
VAAGRVLPDGTVLDGEIVPWNHEMAQPLGFSDLQRRLGRKSPSARIQKEVPVRFLAYDLLEAGGHDLRALPASDRTDLFRWLLERSGLDHAALRQTDHPSLSEDDLALAIREGIADTGIAIEAAARRHGLEFIPLHFEKFELAIRRRNYFEPPVQRLLEFGRGARLREQARLMGGYDVSALGAVAYNA